MPKPTVSVDITKGIDTKRDPRRVEPPYALDIENGELDSVGAVKTRHGSSTLGKGTEVRTGNATSGDVGNEGDISVGKGLYSYEDELLLDTGTELYSYVEGANYWVKAGDLRRTKATLNDIVDYAADHRSYDHATLNGVTVVAWYEDDGIVTDDTYFSVFDEASGAVLVERERFSGGGGTATHETRPPVVVAYNTKILIFAAFAGTLYYRSVDTNEPQASVDVAETTVGSGTSPITNLFDNLTWDVVRDPADSNFAFLAYKDASGLSGSDVVWAWVTETGTTSGHGRHSPLKGTTGAEPDSPLLSVDISDDGLTAAIGFYDGTNLGFLKGVASPDWSTKSNVTYSKQSTAFSPAAEYKLTTTLTGDESDVEVYLDHLGGTVRSEPAIARLYHDGSSYVVDSGWLFSCFLAGHAFRYDSTVFIPVQYIGDSSQDSTQQQYLIVETDLTVVARGLVGRANAALGSSYPALPRAVNLSTGTWRLPVRFKTRAFSDTHSLSLWTVDFDPTLSKPVWFTKGLYFPGSVGLSYDGFDVGETGFLVWPEDVDTTSLSGTGSDYSYRVYYTKYNWRGEVERSTGLTFTENSSSGTPDIKLTLPTIQLDRDADDVVIEIYRTTEGPGKTYYLIDTVDNDTSDTVVEYTDNNADSSITSGLQDYRLAEVDNLSPNPSSVITTGKYKAFSNDTEKPLFVQVSKTQINGEQLSFNDSQVFAVDPEGGDVVALAVMDDLLLIFKKYRIFGLPLSQLPNNAGGGGFSTPRLINTDVGCVDADTVVSSAEGVYFQSDRGLRLLTRGLEVQPVGVLVEDYKDQTFTAATLMPGIPQIRWLVEE